MVKGSMPSARPRTPSQMVSSERHDDKNSVSTARGGTDT